MTALVVLSSLLLGSPDIVSGKQTLIPQIS
jgi:hypothetical protein